MFKGAAMSVEHRKIYHSLKVRHGELTIEIEGPVPADCLKRCVMHPDLDAFRRPKEQLMALIEIAELPEGRIFIAREAENIIGYITFHYPDEMERWSESSLIDLIELGAIEVANAFRCLGLGKQLITLAFTEHQFDNMIVFTTEYYWHWDLRSSGLNVWDYRGMMQRLMEHGGLTLYATDDPEICAHPANCLMVRVGSEVPLTSVEKFDRLRFQRKMMY
jgi:acetoin utilization protein AcuA